MKTMDIENIRQEVKKLDSELQHLITVKSGKLVDKILQEKHTQLSYLNEHDRELHQLFGRKGVLTILINHISKL